MDVVALDSSWHTYVGYVKAYTDAPWERVWEQELHDPEQKLSRFGGFDWTSEIARISHGFGQRMYAIEAWRPEKFEVFEVEVNRLHVLDTRVANTQPANFGGGIA
jgi:hypothetical protein